MVAAFLSFQKPHTIEKTVVLLILKKCFSNQAEIITGKFFANSLICF
jgi:hypothetical protein